MWLKFLSMARAIKLINIKFIKSLYWIDQYLLCIFLSSYLFHSPLIFDIKSFFLLYL